jgi:hypothetical protein
MEIDVVFWGAILFIACAVAVLAALAIKAVQELNEDS